MKMIFLQECDPLLRMVWIWYKIPPGFYNWSTRVLSEFCQAHIRLFEELITTRLRTSDLRHLNRDCQQERRTCAEIKSQKPTAHPAGMKYSVCICKYICTYAIYNHIHNLHNMYYDLCLCSLSPIWFVCPHPRKRRFIFNQNLVSLGM